MPQPPTQSSPLQGHLTLIAVVRLATAPRACPRPHREGAASSPPSLSLLSVPSQLLRSHRGRDDVARTPSMPLTMYPWPPPPSWPPSARRMGKATITATSPPPRRPCHGQSPSECCNHTATDPRRITTTTAPMSATHPPPSPPILSPATPPRPSPPSAPALPPLASAAPSSPPLSRCLCAFMVPGVTAAASIPGVASAEPAPRPSPNRHRLPSPLPAFTREHFSRLPCPGRCVDGTCLTGGPAVPVPQGQMRTGSHTVTTACHTPTATPPSRHLAVPPTPKGPVTLALDVIRPCPASCRPGPSTEAWGRERAVPQLPHPAPSHKSHHAPPPPQATSRGRGCLGSGMKTFLPQETSCRSLWQRGSKHLKGGELHPPCKSSPWTLPQLLCTCCAGAPRASAACLQVGSSWGTSHWAPEAGAYPTGHSVGQGGALSLPSFLEDG